MSDMDIFYQRAARNLPPPPLRTCGGEEFRVRPDPPLRRGGRWSLRVLVRVAYEPTLRRWPRIRLTVEPTWHR